jgi:glutathione S-transferase
MKLYYYPLSTYSQKAMIALNEKGLTYEKQVVNLMSPEERAAFEKISPIGKVPFLQATDDWQVPESTSIIEYIEDKFPDTPELISHSDRETARQTRFMDRMSDLYFSDPVVEVLFQQLGFLPKDDTKAAKMRKYIDMTYGYLDKRLAKQAWLCGNQFTMADCSFIPAMYYAQTVAPFSAYPNIVAYWKRAQQRPSYMKVLAEFEPVWKNMAAQQHAAAA